MRKIGFLLALIVLTGLQVDVQAQTYSSSLPVPPASVVPVTPTPTPLPTPVPAVPTPTPTPVVKQPQPVSGAMDLTYVMLLGGLVICAATMYKLKLKSSEV